MSHTASKSRPPALRARGLQRQFRLGKKVITVLEGVDLTVAEGEWVVLTGPSGCGKTTLLHLLGLLDRPNGGELALFGETPGRWPWRAAQLRRRHIGFIFQSYQLFPELTAWENVWLAGSLAGLSGGRQRAAKLLETVGLGDRLAHRPTELSGGEQQRVAIARALMNDPRLILADEPTGNLDTHNANLVLDLLRTLCAKEGRSIVMVTHDQALRRYAQATYVMADGHLQTSSASKV